MNSLFAFLAGLVLLVIGGELLVRGASRIALSFGISPLVVGLTVVAFGTSAPELAVSVQSVRDGQVDLAIGNVVGSSIFNVLFILGLSAAIAPLFVNRQLIRQEVPIMLAASVLLFFLAFDGMISLVEGGILASLLLLYTVVTVIQARRQGATDADSSPAPDDGWRGHWAIQLLLIGAGLALLVLGADWLVEAAIQFARVLGISELVIGLTIVAIGTSLPEVATSLIATVRGERDIAVGNVVGSNLFNILGVVGVSTLFSASGLTVQPALISFDLPVMIAVAFACLPIFFTGNLIARWEGLLFLALYVAYTTYLVLLATRHEFLPTYSLAMLAIVAPLVTGTLAVVTVRELRRRRRARNR